MLSSPRRAPLALLWVAVVVLLMSSLAQSDDGGCKNTLPDRKCSRLQRRGKCGRVFARNRCRQTCGLCLDRDELFAAASPPPPPRRGFAAFVKDPDNDQDRAINSYLGLIQTMHGYTGVSVDEPAWWCFWCEPKITLRYDHLRRVFAPLGITDIHIGYDYDTDTEFLVTATAGAILVSFSGSDEAKDWFGSLMEGSGNFNIWSTSTTEFGSPAVRVHTGFLKSFRGSLSAGLRRIVDAKRAAHPSAALAFAGHSKGAATATLAAAHFVAQGYRVDGLYVAGSPRVGVTSSWAQRVKDLGLHSRMVRWFDSRDVVAFIPIIDGLLWGDDYVHAGLPYDITTCRYNASNAMSVKPVNETTAATAARAMSLVPQRQGAAATAAANSSSTTPAAVTMGDIGQALFPYHTSYWYAGELLRACVPDNVAAGMPPVPQNLRRRLQR